MPSTEGFAAALETTISICPKFCKKTQLIFVMDQPCTGAATSSADAKKQHEQQRLQKEVRLLYFELQTLRAMSGADKCDSGQ
jgi:hypothetical protein